MRLFRKVEKKDIKESKKRHILKTFSWRILATTTTFLIAYILTGSLAIGGSIASIEFFAKMILYYYHERVWFRIKLK